MENIKSPKNEIPIWEKYLLTIEESSVYFHIGEGKLRELIAYNPHATFFLKNGKKVLLKRKKFEEFLDNTGSL